MTCNATGLPLPEIDFYIGDILLNSTVIPFISITDPINDSYANDNITVYLATRSLVITNTSDEDSNNYTCVATNINRIQPSVSVQFELIVNGEHVCTCV